MAASEVRGAVSTAVAVVSYRPLPPKIPPLVPVLAPVAAVVPVAPRVVAVACFSRSYTEIPAADVENLDEDSCNSVKSSFDSIKR